MKPAPFNQNYNSLSEQALRDKKAIPAGTTGPYSPASKDPNSYKNPFVREINNNAPARDFYQQAWAADSAAEQQSRIDSLGNFPNFPDSGDQTLAQDFLTKYYQGMQRGLVNGGITAETLAPLQTQTAVQGLGENAASRMTFAGTGSTKIS
jgi:hypothetical protein